MKFYTYEVHWLDGKVETIMGCDFVHALTRAGYGNGAVQDIDFYKKVG